MHNDPCPKGDKWIQESFSAQESHDENLMVHEQDQFLFLISCLNCRYACTLMYCADFCTVFFFLTYHQRCKSYKFAQLFWRIPYRLIINLVYRIWNPMLFLLLNWMNRMNIASSVLSSRDSGWELYTRTIISFFILHIPPWTSEGRGRIFAYLHVYS